jgi:hypothetical protein
MIFEGIDQGLASKVYGHIASDGVTYAQNH